MDRIFIYTLLILLTGLTACSERSNNEATSTDPEFSIMVFSKTDGWRHDSIEPGLEVIKQYAADRGVFVFATEDASHFNEDNLNQFDAVFFFNTSETVMENSEQREAFEKFIQAGGGFIGTHSALDTEYEWPWYNGLVGGYFESHPNNPNVLTAVIKVNNHEHLASKMLPERWERRDEWYNFRDFNENVHVLMELDTDSYEGSTHENYHPISWYHEYDGGRAFYTGLGHTIESYTEDELFMKHLWGGIEYAVGVSQ